ncbi:MAG: glycoside hydrolase family 78 protein [Pirellulales bacterium]|nr:glycoside hydrolase family 78 protein [Pirellulales bacterium]
MRWSGLGGLVLILEFFIPSVAAGSGVAAEDLRCEYLTNPEGIDVALPRLSWSLRPTGAVRRGERQTAYQILVAGEPSSLNDDRGDLWDSGKVASDRCYGIVYGGKTLLSYQRCFWKVRVWDRDGRVSPWSEPARWSMGVLDPGQWRGKWLRYVPPADPEEKADGQIIPWEKKTPSPVFRKEFDVRKPLKRATVFICGLGFYELRINGKKVGDRVLDPIFTRYDQRVLYATYEVGNRLVEGRNALGVLLGRGFYDVPRSTWRSDPTLFCQLRLEYADGATETVATDATWRAAAGPIRHDGVFLGEDYDARREMPGWDAAHFGDSAWAEPEVVPPPAKKFSAEMAPPIRVMQTLKPVGLTEPKPGVFVFDLGQNMVGWAQLKVTGPAGTRVVMRFGERLHPDGTVDQEKIAMYVKYGPFQTDFYTLKGGDEEVWEPRFTYHGFRWVEVTGFPGRPTLDSLCGRVVHTAFTPAGAFECSNALLNKIQQSALWSYRGNFVGLPTDCPHREKSGWTGDAHLAAEQAMFNFENVAGYETWLTGLRDEQRPGGELPCIIPAYDWCYGWGNGPAWDSAYILVPWYLYLYRGDVRVLETHYDNLKRYVDYLQRRSKNDLVDFGLGDWVPAKTETPVAITSTGYFYCDARLVSRFATILGRDADAKHYAALAEKIRRAWREKYIHNDGTVNGGSQTAQSCALFQGFAAPDERDAIVNKLAKNVEEHAFHLDTGILGAKYLFRALSDNGRHDLAYRIAVQTTPPSYGSWIERGATTLWEDWGDGLSRNHVAFSDISAWFYQYLAGINADPEQPGFKHIILRPRPVGDLTFVKAWHRSPYGKIESDWRIENGRFHWHVTVPPSASATVFIPTSDGSAVLEGGRPAVQSEGVRFLRPAPGAAVYEIPSGTYDFSAPYAPK